MRLGARVPGTPPLQPPRPLPLSSAALPDIDPSSPGAAPATDGLPTPQRYSAMVTVIAGIGLSVLDGTVMNLALPGIAADMKANSAEVIWVVNAYQVAILALLLPLARLGDLRGYRKVYLSGLAVFTLASLGCMASRSLAALCAARALQGAGAAGMFAINAALLRAIYPRRLLGRGIAINSVVVALASVAGPSVAAVVLSVASWPWLFAINLPLGIAVFSLGLRSLPRHDAGIRGDTRLRPADIALNIAMFVLVFLGVDRLVPRPGSAGGALPWAAFALLGAGSALALVHVRRQRRLELPLLPIDLLRIPVFRLSMGTSITAFSAQMLAAIALPFLLLQAFGRSPADAGLVLSAWPIATVCAAPLAGRLIGRVPDALLAGIGLFVLALGLGLAATMPVQPSLAQIGWRLALCGAGFGFFQSPNNHSIVTSAPTHRSGAAGGMLATARLAGQSAGAVGMAVLFSLALPTAQAAPRWGLGIAALCATIAGVISLRRLDTRAGA
ncbi:MAG: MFS transporter [Burkholderiales bacterium]|nr:MFS transporter [Burkholderiales bacterium]